MKTRMPTQKRSIEKRNLIIEKGFYLMCNEGYYNINTNDIAKYAGVSTGIIYQYFNDKKDIFIEGIKIYSNNIMFPMLNVLDTEKIDVKNLDKTFSTMIDKYIKNHTMTKKAHEEIMAMIHLDDDIGSIYCENELKTTEKIVSILENNNIKMENAKEKVHIIMGIVDNFAHEMVYHKHEDIDYNVMKDVVIKVIISILK